MPIIIAIIMDGFSDSIADQVPIQLVMPSNFTIIYEFLIIIIIIAVVIVVVIVIKMLSHNSHEQTEPVPKNFLIHVRHE